MAPQSAVLQALSQLDFEFEDVHDSADSIRTRGFGPDTVVELDIGHRCTVSLLCSASSQAKALARSSVCIVTLSKVLGVDFTGWLSQEMSRLGASAPWIISRRFGKSNVSAELFTADAMLLTIDMPRGALHQ
jgi:hypothetical protein